MTVQEQALAQSAGEARYARRRAAGSQQRYGRDAKAHTVELEVEAIGAEIAVARQIGREWVDTDRPDYDGDVGPGVQVRHTRHLNGRLILHEGDHDDHDFFLVIGTYPSLAVVGWISGAEGKRVGVVRELQRGRPCICVDGEHLQSPAGWVDPLSAEEPQPEEVVEVVLEPEEPVVVPSFVRKAMLAQGLYDPDEIAVAAAKIDLSAPMQEEIVQEPLVHVEAPAHWQDRG